MIGAGFGRTGTHSVKVALERLGFAPCYHMSEVRKNPEHIALWSDVAEGRSLDWDGLFGTYRATSDFPACLFYRKLMDVYPDAKVLLTVRDPERWYTSTLETSYALSMMDNFPLLDLRLRRIIFTLVWDGLFDGRFQDRDYAISVFNRWIEEVRETVPAERLLVFDVKEGWEPMCRFLGVSVPDASFPKVNDTAQIKAIIEMVRRGEPLVIPGVTDIATQPGHALP